MGLLIPKLSLSLFTSDAELIRIATEGLRIIVIMYPLVGFQMVASNFFQSIGMVKKAIFLAITRQVLFLIPCLLIFPHFWGVKGIWISMPAADFVSCIVSAVMMWHHFRTLKTI
jgi:Na+-driven multidrug efflux pump